MQAYCMSGTCSQPLLLLFISLFGDTQGILLEVLREPYWRLGVESGWICARKALPTVLSRSSPLNHRPGQCAKHLLCATYLFQGDLFEPAELIEHLLNKATGCMCQAPTVYPWSQVRTQHKRSPRKSSLQHPKELPVFHLEWSVNQ